jgi:hypothetical protein
MTKSHLKAAIIGGLIVFLWGVISWMVLPWHEKCFKKFADESEVAEVITDNAKETGVYILPNTFGYRKDASPKEMNKAMQMMQKGPFMFAIIHPNGMGKMSAKPFVISFITAFIGAYIAISLFMHAKGLTFNKKVGFFALFGLGVAVLGELPLWNWWGLPFGFTLVHMLDHVIAWSLAGLGIVKILKK